MSRACGSLILILASLFAPAPASAQISPCPDPAALPPADSAALYRCAELRFHPVNESRIDAETYAHQLKAAWSKPSEGLWAPYDADKVRADFWQLWRTNFLDDLWIEVIDEPFANGVAGKHVVFHLEERARVKVVEYSGSKRIEISKIDDALREQHIEVRLDAFIDPAVLRRASGVIRDLYAKEGFHGAVVTPHVAPLPEGAKLVRVAFEISEGPQYVISEVVFDGNEAFSGGELRGQLKANREKTWLSFVTDAGRYQEDRFDEDADLITEWYFDHGYARARVGMPVVEIVRDSKDGRTREIRLRVPVEEGASYRVGALTIAGNTIVKTEFMRPLFDLDTGAVYSRAAIMKGLERARDAYGAAGYWQFAPDIDLQFPDETPGVVNITMTIAEGKQFFVNRLSFLGNTTTRDGVIRREMRLAEGGLFSTEALKSSVRRLNQLGYFKALEGREGEVDVAATPGKDDRVDVTVKVEEQNRNQFSFGAGLSELDGIFGQFSFQTSNFLGRGETVSVSAQRGSQAVFNQIAFTKPYLFERPISLGANLFSRRNDYNITTNEVGYSEARNGAGLTAGVSLGGYWRLFASFNYETIETAVLEALRDGSADATAGAPVFDPIADQGKHVESRVTPSLMFDTVDHPQRPRRGVRLTATADVAGGPLRGTVNYVRPEVEMIVYVPQGKRMALGLRAQAGWVRPYGATETLPYYRRFFLGGEQQIRGTNFRSVGPLNAQQQVLGGDKFVLFNAEYYLDLGPVRALAFHDAGQAFLETEPINLRRLRSSTGVEARFVMPVINVPFRVIYAWNFFRDSFQPNRTFKFGVGSTF